MFQELGVGEIARLLILSAVVCLLCLWAVRWKNRTALSKGGRKPRGILMPHTSTVYETDGWRVYWAESTLWAENLETGQSICSV